MFLERSYSCLDQFVLWTTDYKVVSHFRLDELAIAWITAVGRATSKLIAAVYELTVELLQTVLTCISLLLLFVFDVCAINEWTETMDEVY